MFEKEFRYFTEHQDELVAKHRGQVLTIKGEEVIGVFGSALEAFLETSKTLAPGTFMLQPCEPGPSAYTITLSSHELF
jgi:hypothetical protein